MLNGDLSGVSEFRIAGNLLVRGGKERRWDGWISG